MSAKWAMIGVGLGVLATLVFMLAIGKGSLSGASTAINAITGLEGENSLSTINGTKVKVVDAPQPEAGKQSIYKTEKVTTAAQQQILSFHDLLLKMLNLRDAYITDVIRTSQLVKQINTAVYAINNGPIISAWETLTVCLSKQCSDDDFLSFINVIAIEGDRLGISYGDIVANLITANKYWNTDNVVRKSEAINYVDERVKGIADSAISAGWADIVACDGKCADKNTKLFAFIRTVAEKFG